MEGNGPNGPHPGAGKILDPPRHTYRTATISRDATQGWLPATLGADSRSCCMDLIAFHRLPVAAALALPVAFSTGLMIGISSLVHAPAARQVAACDATCFLAKLHASPGGTVWR